MTSVSDERQLQRPMFHDGTMTVYLRDGRHIDLTGLSREAAVQRLREYGAGPGDIERTVHEMQGKGQE